MQIKMCPLMHSHALIVREGNRPTFLAFASFTFDPVAWRYHEIQVAEEGI